MAPLPCIGKVIWHSRSFLLESSTCKSFSRRCQRCRKIGSCLPFGALEAEAFEVRLYIHDRTKEDLSTLVQDENLIELLVCLLWCLVKRHQSCGTAVLCSQTYRLAKLDCIRRIKTFWSSYPTPGSAHRSGLLQR